MLQVPSPMRESVEWQNVQSFLRRWFLSLPCRERECFLVWAKHQVAGSSEIFASAVGLPASLSRKVQVIEIHTKVWRNQGPLALDRNMIYSFSRVGNGRGPRNSDMQGEHLLGTTWGPRVPCVLLCSCMWRDMCACYSCPCATV